MMEKNFLLVRYGEIGTKSEPVRSKMIDNLRQRVEDRLEHEGLEYGKVSVHPGRVIAEGLEDAGEAARKVSETPGVASVSPAKKIESSIEEMKNTAEEVEVSESFGIDASRSGKHGFDSQEVKEEVGEHVRKNTGAEVDLDNLGILIEFEIRGENTYVFTERFKGPDGVPVGSAGKFAALISGGIDSPVAAHEAMERGCDIVPVYFYNVPVAAEDHYLRFRSVCKKLKRFNFSRDWKGFKIDMGEVNEELMEIGRGRMVIHRRLMFRVAEEICEQEGLNGIVTGESLSQKSSQTPQNLEKTSKATDYPVHRPLITHSKNEITEKARELGTFRDAEIASACQSLAPDNPATRLSEPDLEKLERQVGFEDLVEKALDSMKEIDL
ncbi:MAG: tRNA uracil 4-sulfurtransferase ThiI [Candidatus Nanosalina sp.]